VPEGNSTVHGQRLGRHRSTSSAGTGKLALKVGLCLCAGQLVAGPLASAAEAAPVAVTAKVPTVTPRVAEQVSKTKITAGSLLRVGVRVIDPRTNKGVTHGKVRLQYASKGWKTWVTRSVNSKGIVTFRVRPGSSLRLRSVYSGTSVIKSRASNVIKVTATRSSAGAKILAEAKRHTGALYLYAAAGPSRFDCSGYTMYVYRKAVGRKLPHKANSQQHYGKAVSKGSKRVGDLIVFRSGSYGYHAAIYAGGNYMYDSPHSGARVGKHKIFSSSYVVRRLA
jgi:cell wall-associated NlpC family hydrolase